MPADKLTMSLQAMLKEATDSGDTAQAELLRNVILRRARDVLAVGMRAAVLEDLAEDIARLAA